MPHLDDIWYVGYVGLGLRAAEVIEVCFPRIYKECPLSRTFDPLRCTSEAS